MSAARIPTVEDAGRRRGDVALHPPRGEGVSPVVAGHMSFGTDYSKATSTAVCVG